MSIDERLDQTMRAAADSVEPPVAKLVDGGLARGRRKRRRRVAAAVGGLLAVTSIAASGAVALPDMLSGSPDVIADAGEEEVERVAPSTAPDATSDQAPVVIEDLEPAVSGDQLTALLEDVAALTGGTLQPSDGPTNPPHARIELEFDFASAEVDAYVADLGTAEDPCDGNEQCEVAVEEDSAFVRRSAFGRWDAMTYFSSAKNLRAGVRTPDGAAGVTVADLGFADANAFRNAVLSAVPDAEDPARTEFTADELNDIAKEVAELSTATSGRFAPMNGLSRQGRVSLDGADAFDVRVSHDVDGNDLAVWTEACERGESDGKPCDELMNTGEIGMFASTYPHQGDRESLRFVADLAVGTLIITFDNYMETASGKVVGSSLSEAGIDPDELVSVVESAGLLD